MKKMSEEYKIFGEDVEEDPSLVECQDSDEWSVDLLWE